MTLRLIYKSPGGITPHWHGSGLTYGNKCVNCSLVLNAVFERTNLSTMSVIKGWGKKSMGKSLFSII